MWEEGKGKEEGEEDGEGVYICCYGAKTNGFTSSITSARNCKASTVKYRQSAPTRVTTPPEFLRLKGGDHQHAAKRGCYHSPLPCIRPPAWLILSF